MKKMNMHMHSIADELSLIVTNKLCLIKYKWWKF